MFIPGSPKAPFSSFFTLAPMLTFLVIKDGQEDKMRRKKDEEKNKSIAKIYSYGMIGFQQRHQEDIRVGDLVTVFNNQEVPADLLLINVGQKNAFFDTVNLNGETNLSPKYSISRNVNTSELQSFKGAIFYEEANSNLESFSGKVSL